MTVVFGVVVITSAAIDSAQAKRGEAVGYKGLLGLDLLPWSDTEVAAVTWTGTGTAPVLPGCVIRLGEAASVEVLYDPYSKQTLRLPAASVTVTIKPRAEKCPAE